MKKLLGLLAALIAAAAIYLAVTPSPIDPLAWDAPKIPPMTGILEPNDTLMKAELLGRGQVHGPEDTAVDAQGQVYSGLHDGRIVRIKADGSVETFVDTQGRPLGMDFDAAGNLIVADAYKGLLSIDAQGQIKVLTTEAEGVPFKFTDDLDIARDGTIYFSDASQRFEQPDYLLDLLALDIAHAGHGHANALHFLRPQVAQHLSGVGFTERQQQNRGLVDLAQLSGGSILTHRR